MKKYLTRTKLPYEKQMLRQIEWWVQNDPITKNEFLPRTTLFFWKFCFSQITSYKKLIWCTNHPNVHIHTFCKRRSFILRCFFPVSMFKMELSVKIVNSFQPLTILSKSSTIDVWKAFELASDTNFAKWDVC